MQQKVCESNSYIVGIDPGTTGAIAAVNADGGVVLVERLVARNHGWGGATKKHLCAESVYKVFEKLRSGVILCVSIERQSPRSGQAAIAMSLGDSFGVARAIACAWVGYENVRHPRPQEWQREYGGKEGWEKSDSIRLSRELFGVELKQSQHDLADALLIAEHARRHS